MNTTYLYPFLAISCLFFTIKNVEINKVETSLDRFEDIGLVEFENGILFASDRVGADERNSNLLRIYSAEILEDYTLEDPQLLSAKSKFHLFPNDYDAAKKEIYFTGNSKSKASNGVYKLAILKGTIEGTKIVDLEYLNFNTPENNYAYATLSEDGTTMILSADIDGDFDLFEYERKDTDAAWTLNRKLTELESPFREVHPNLLNDSTLVFSSDNDIGLGKLDLYMSKKVNGIWDAPINLVELNSAFDEFNYIALDDLNGYFTSNRGGEKTNIYQFKINQD